MTNETFKDIEKLESDLWAAADHLRANSKLTSSDYFMPVLGVIFLRHAANRFEAAHRQIEEDQASGKMPKRKVLPSDYLRRRALWLPENRRRGRDGLYLRFRIAQTPSEQFCFGRGATDEGSRAFQRPVGKNHKERRRGATL